MRWTEAQRVRVLAVMAPDLTPYQWAERMGCEIDEVWRALATARRHHERVLRAMAQITSEEVSDETD